MKWFIFRFFVSYFHWKVMSKAGWSLSDSWDYSEGFDNYFEDAEWRSLISNA